jgi:phosphoglycerate dehydrogenase-like enzyme
LFAVAAAVVEFSLSTWDEREAHTVGIPEALYSGMIGRFAMLTVLLYHSKETHHFLSTEEFELLHKSNRDGTYIANISRGGIIDQAALIKALELKQIRGAALDVTDPEPLPSDDPLWSAPNVLITPHIR